MKSAARHMILKVVIIAIPAVGGATFAGLVTGGTVFVLGDHFWPMFAVTFVIVFVMRVVGFQ